MVAYQAHSAILTVGPGKTHSTIQACADVAVAGDTCEVYTATYNETVTLANDGSSGSWITFKSATGEFPINTGWHIEQRHYIEINGFTCGEIDGLSVTGAGSNIKILNNTITNTLNAVRIWADDVLISGNTFSGIGQDVFETFGERTTIRNNSIIDGYGDPTGVLHSDFWQSWCAAGNYRTGRYVLIENNTVIGAPGSNTHFGLVNETGGTGKEDCEPPTNIIVRYNKVWNVGSNAFNVDAINQQTGTGDNSIYNNTWGLFKQDGTPVVSIHQMSGSLDSDGINNVFYDTLALSAVGFQWGTGGAQSHNLYFDPDETLTFDGLASDEVGAIKNENPLLVDPGNNDFTFPSNSPAIDTGGPLTLTSGSGISSSTLVVDDATLFQAGWGGVEADTIYIRNVARPDVLIDFEAGANNDTIDLTYLASVTRGGSGTWSLNNTPNADVDTTYFKHTNYSTYVDGTWYDDSVGTSGMQYNTVTTSEESYNYTFSSQSKVTAISYMRIPQITQWGVSDMLMLQSSLGGYCVAQVLYDTTTRGIQAHVAASEFGSTSFKSSDQEPPEIIDYGAYIDDWIVVKLTFDNSDGTCSVSAYDPDDFSLIGSADITDAGQGSTMAGKTIETLLIGNNTHGNTEDPHYYDNVMLSFGSTTLMPTGAVQSVKISSIDYSTNTITLESAISWNDGDEVGLYEDSDGTVVYSGLSPDIGAYEYQPLPTLYKLGSGELILQ